MKELNVNKYDLVNEKGQIHIGKVSDFLIERHNIGKIDGRMYIYRDGAYTPDCDILEKEIVALFPETKRNTKDEILWQISVKINDLENWKRDRGLIAFRNGIYDPMHDKMMEFSKDLIVTNKYPFDYNPNAYSPLMDKVLDKVCCYDPDTRKLLAEASGACFYRMALLGKAFVLLGEKSNGKSVYQAILRQAMGDENYSSCDLSDLSNNRFAAADLIGMSANISDDISGQFIADASTFKSITTGERIRAEAKHKDAVQFTPYATLLFSANVVPKVKNADGGVRRRMMIIPFLQKFSPNDPDYDPDIKAKLLYGTDDCSKDESMSYFISFAMEGLRRVLQTGKFTETDKCNEAIDEYDRDCNPILDWIDEFLPDTEENSFEGIIVKDAFADYKDWAETSGQKPLSMREFSKRIKERFGLATRTIYYKDVGNCCTFYKKDED